MRLVSALLLVALTGSITLADEAKPADPKPEVTKRKVPLRVVRILPETHQVLLFDKHRGTHVVAEVGQDVDGFVVDEIDDDEVTLIGPSGAEVILAAPDATWKKRQSDRRASRAAKAPGTDSAYFGSASPPADLQPMDPYGSGESSAAPIVAGEGGVRVASATDKGPTAAPLTASDLAAPPDPYGDPGIAAFVDAVGAASTPSPTSPVSTPATKASKASVKSTTSPDAAGSLAAAATGTTAPSATGAASTFNPTRNEVDTALGDFGATAVTFDAKFVAGGLRFDQIAAGTILGKVGLRAGDILTTVDNIPLRSIDDAASLYARVGTARSATLSVLRAGKPMTWRVAIR
jgi:hypothetical protein